MAYIFSTSILNCSPFVEGEASISLDAKYSFLYSRDVLNHSFYLGEFSISQCSDYSLMYSLLWGKPFPEGEIAISSHAMYSAEYAKRILFGRFEMGEPAIFEDVVEALNYCLFFRIKIPEAENIISSDSYSSYMYSTIGPEERFFLGEDSILESPSYSRKYSCEKGIEEEKFKRSIFKVPSEALLYSRKFLYEGDDVEDSISMCGDSSLNYAIAFNKRFEKGEEAIMIKKENNKAYVAHLKSLRYLDVGANQRLEI
jgi:hypothetical protein